MTRLPAGGRIDRGRELRFTFNGTALSGFAGDTLASALLANGVHQVGTSIKYGRPRGIMAALTAARSGARVVLADDQPETGGSLLGAAESVDGAPAMDWVTSVTASLEQSPDVRILRRTTAFGCYDDGFVLALERRTDHLGLAAPAHRARQRVWRIRAREVIVAAGAHERPVIFTDNDVPGVMLASAARTYLHRYGVLVGRPVVAFTTNDSAYPAAVDMARAGAAVSVVDARGEIPQCWASVCARNGVAVRTGSVVTGASGGAHVTAAHVAAWSGGAPGPRQKLGCDLLLVSGGWNPAVHLFTHAGGELRYDAGNGMFVPGSRPAGLQAAGAGLTSAEHVKRYTTIGTAHDQVKTSGVSTSGILAAQLGVDIATLGTTTLRPPYTPVAFAALAGRDRGEIFDSVRVTAIHPWHVKHGAVLEDVGQWKQPWTVPPSEDQRPGSGRR